MEIELLVIAGFGAVCLAIVTFCQVFTLYTSYMTYKMNKLSDSDMSEMVEYAKEFIGNQKRSKEVRVREEKAVR